MKTMLNLLLTGLLGLGVISPAQAASTEGTATFKVTLADPPGNYSARVDAFWVTDSAGNWVQNARKDFSTRGRYLYQWRADAGPNTNIIDGFSGATISGNFNQTVWWDGRDANNIPLPDGDYRFYVEFTDHNDQGWWTTNGVPFTKGPTRTTNAYPDIQYITAMQVIWAPWVHDVAIARIAPNTAQTNVTVPVLVTVTNKGNYSETFTVILSNSTTATLIGTQTVTALASNASAVTFNWNTAGYALGDYTLVATALPVAGETSLADNTYTNIITLQLVPHDIAITGFTPPAGFTNASTPLHIFVTNETITAETFSLSTSNLTTSTLVNSQQVVLSGNKASDVYFLWNTSNMIAGDYVLQAIVGPVAGELHVADNVFTNTITLRYGASDLAVLRISPPPLVTMPATNTVTVTITNQGDFNVVATAYLFDDTDARSLGSTPFFAIPGTTATASFTWRTTNTVYGYHRLRSYTSPLKNEVDLLNNTNTILAAVGAGWTTNTFIAKGSVWRFNDNGLDLGGTPWNLPEYYDQVWSSSPAPLGYSTGTPPLHTNMNYVMSYGPDANNKYPTYYLRNEFFADALPTNLVLNVRRDDGVVFFLNGAELARFNMPTGAIGYYTNASTDVTGERQYIYYSTNVSPDSMVLGRNVLAAELHQYSSNSPDVVLDVELRGAMPMIPANHDVDAIAINPVGDVIAGDGMSVTITITNSGNMTETALVYLKDVTSGQVTGPQTVAGLAPTNTATLNFNWSTVGATPGLHTLQAFTVVNGVTNLAGSISTTANISSSGFGLNALNAAGAIGGRCAVVQASGNLLLVGSGASLELWDRSVAASPSFLGSVRLPGLIEHIAINGSWAYVACGNAGVQFVDITVPVRPLHRNSFSTSGHAYQAAVNGGYLYVADGVAGLRIVNISNPLSPSVAGAYYTEGPARAVAVNGSTACLVDAYKGLLVLNVSHPNIPTLSGFCGFDAGQAVAVSGSTAYVVDANNHFYSINISGTPSLLGSLLLPNIISQSLALNGTTAYVGAGDSGLLVVNVANASAPALSSTIPTAGQAVGLSVGGTTLYVANGFAGFKTYNVSTPAAPALQNTFPTSIRAADVATEGDYAYVAAGEAGLRIYAITNPAAPVLVATSTLVTNARCIAVSSPFARVADGDSTVKSFFINNPAAPSLAGTYSSSNLGLIRNIGASGGMVVISDGRKLELLGGTSALILLGTYNAPAFMHSLAVSGTRAYLACGEAGLLILNITSDSPLTLLGSYNSAGLATGVSVSGNTVYLADGTNGWLTLDVSNPASPLLVKTSTAQGPVAEVAASGLLATIANGANQAMTIDVTAPLTPVPKTSFAPLVRALRLSANGLLVAVAEDEAGVALLSNNPDLDNDGLPDSWEQQIVNASLAANGPIRTIADVRPNDDFDGDGSSNYAEYLAGTSPTDPNSRFMVYVANPTTSSVTLRWYSVAGRTYTVYSSTNVTQPFTILQDNIAATPGTNSVTIPSPGTPAFYMIGVR